MPRALDLPSQPGAYVLFIETMETVALSIKGKSVALLPGGYLYCGSAKGPGGIRARVERHLRTDKAMHWHVDRLTALGNIKGVMVARDGNECDLLDRLATLPECDIPAPGFGSSDCRRCRAHLLSAGDLDHAMAQLSLRPSETYFPV